MAIIYTYPTKATLALADLVIISDSEDANKTKQATMTSIKDVIDVVDSLTATLPLLSSSVTGSPDLSISGVSGYGTAGQVMRMNAGATALEWATVSGGSGDGLTIYDDGSGVGLNITKLDFIGSGVSAAVDGTSNDKVNVTIAGGGSPGGSDHSVQYKNGSAFAGGNDLTFHPTNNIFSVKHTVIVKGQGNGNPAGRLILNCEQDSHALTLEGPAHSGGADYTLKFPSAAPGNTQILQSNNSGQLSWITTPSGGGGGVSQVTAGGVLGTSSGAPISISPTTGNVVVTSQAYAGTTNVGHVPSGGSSITFLRGDGTWVTPTNTTYSVMGSGNSYAAGLVLAGNVTHSDQYLRKDGTWGTPLNTNAVDTVSAGTSGASSGSALTVSPTTGAVKVTSNSYAGTSNVGHVPAGGSSTTFLRGDGTWVVPTDTTSIALTTTGTSGASTWNGTTLNIPQYSGGGGSGASLGFAPLEIYSANGVTIASYIYYMVAVCDVDFTVNKCKVAVTSGTGPIYVTVYSMDYGSLQTSTLTKLGALNNSGSIAGVNELSLTESAFSLTAGQTICIGVSTANVLSAGTGINNTDLGVMATSGGGSALPANPDFESLGSANKRPAIHFYAS